MKKLNIKNFKFGLKKKNLGMSYVELIVVLGIFSIMSGIVMLNYDDFNSQIEVKSLSNDVALKIVEAQKLAMSGQLLSQELQEYQAEMGVNNWRPAYGLFFDTKKEDSFIYFTDLDNSSISDSPENQELRQTQMIDFNGANGCDNTKECLDEIKINQNYSVNGLDVYCGLVGSIPKENLQAAASGGVGDDKGEEGSQSIEEFANDIQNADGGDNQQDTSKIAVEKLSITFTRPDSMADIRTSSDVPCKISGAVINLSSGSVSSSITIYPSGRIQIK